MKRLKLWFARRLYEMLSPKLHQTVENLVEMELANKRRLSADIRKFITDDLNQRIPVESTTHALACHVRDHALAIEKRVAALEQDRG